MRVANKDSHQQAKGNTFEKPTRGKAKRVGSHLVLPAIGPGESRIARKPYKRTTGAHVE
mgnify:CR=1 FL=1